MKANELTPDKNMSFLFKAPPGFGKTLAAASFALEGPIYIAYFDKKKPVELLNYFHNIVKRPDLLDNITYDTYSAANAQEYLNHLYKLTKDCRYVAHITDSVTNLTSAAVNWSLGFNNNSGAQRATMPGFDEYKVETSLVSQALDVCRSLPCHIIWTAHPLPGIKIEGSGRNITVSKVNPIVSYGSKVAGLVPGNFSEIYHFSKDTDWNTTPETIKYTVNTDAVGDDYAKSAIGMPRHFDITNQLFYQVWKELVNNGTKA